MALESTSLTDPRAASEHSMVKEKETGKGDRSKGVPLLLS